jgi:hypothetical protein
MWIEQVPTFKNDSHRGADAGNIPLQWCIYSLSVRMQNSGQGGAASDLLVVVLDVNPLIWGPRAHQNASSSSSTPSRGRRRVSDAAEAAPSLLTFPRMLEHVLVFLNTFLITNRRNRIVVIGAWTGQPYVGVIFLFSFCWPA